MERLPPLKALRVFQIAAEVGSFKLAAEKLHVTQAAVSQQIRQLEEFFGEALFVRLNREVQLTPSGLRLLPFLQEGFASISKGAKELSADPNPDQLKITALPSFAARWLIPKLGEFQQQHPDISCFVSTSCELHDFSDDSQDVAIRFTTGGNTALDEQKIAPDYIVPLCHPMLKAKLDEQPGGLAQLPLLIDESEELEVINDQFKQMFGAGSRVILQLQDSNLLLDAALNGQGVAPVRYSLAYEYLARGQLVPVSAHYWDSPFSNYFVAAKGHFGRRKVQFFLQWLTVEAAAIEQHWQRFHQQEQLIRF